MECALAAELVDKCHCDSSDEIRRLEVAQTRKRRAEDEDLPLRQIFDNVCRTSADAWTASVFRRFGGMYV